MKALAVLVIAVYLLGPVVLGRFLHAGGRERPHP